MDRHEHLETPAATRRPEPVEPAREEGSTSLQLWLGSARGGYTAAGSAPSGPPAIPPSTLIALQRSAGNAAVGTLLAPRPRVAALSAAIRNGGPVGQRLLADGAGRGSMTVADVASVGPSEDAPAEVPTSPDPSPAIAAGDGAAPPPTGSAPGAPNGADGRTPRQGRSAAGLAATEALALDEDDIAYIEEVLEAEEAAAAEESAGTSDEAAGEGSGEASSDETAETAIVVDRGTAMTGIVADGSASGSAARSMAELDPGSLEGIARAGVVTDEFSESAFRSLQALGFIDIGSAKVYPPSAVLEINGLPPEGSGFKKQWRLLPTTTKDHNFTAKAAPAGTYDTGLTVSVTVGGGTVELKKLVEVTPEVAAKCKVFEQEHVDDTSAAFQMSFEEAASAVNHFADAPDGKDPIYFRGSDEATVAAYVEGRLTDYHSRPKLGGKQADWVSAYKKLLGLTISERDAKGTHSWSLARSPKVDRAAGTVTYKLEPPSANAGAPWDVISWDKV